MSEIEALFRKHADLVYRIAVLYLRNKNDAEDAVQMTFMKCIEKKPSFDNDDHARAWLLVTAKNICRNHLSYWFNRLKSPSDLLESVAVGDSENRETLEAVLSLPEKNREVIYLYYYEGYKTEEISKLLSRNHSTVRTQLVRGREILKNSLGGDESEKTTAGSQL